MSKKFSIYSDAKGETILDVVVASMRTGLAEGFKVAIESTVHDSSNAAAHWMVGVQGKTRPGARKPFGHPVDLRGKGNPLVGSKGDKGRLRADTVEKVLDREIREVISKYAAGNSPETNFYFFNAIGGVDGYKENASIIDAGNSGIRHAVKVFEREIASGKVLQRRRKMK